MHGKILVGIVLCCSVTLANRGHAVDVTPSANGGPSAQTLANNIVNDSQIATNIVSVGVASTNVNNPGVGNPPSDPRAMGTFVNGNTPAGTPLPAGDAAYVGGLGISSGVCLCTGFVSDSIAQAGTGLGFGVEGPNNGDGEGILGDPPQNHFGEISRTLVFGELDGTAFVDQDFEDFAFPDDNPGGGDPTVLQFPITITKPGYLRLSFVFGSDEHPFYDDNTLFDFNDSIAIIVDGENIATINQSGVLEPFSLFVISECPQLFVENNTAPSPAILTPENNPPNLHAISSADRYDVEFGGFTKPLTRETTKILAPGTYTVKIVVQDVVDRRVDAAVFVAENSVILYPFLLADFDLNGYINGRDYFIWSRNYGATNATFQQGDANGDGIVNPTSPAPLKNQ